MRITSRSQKPTSRPWHNSQPRPVLRVRQAAQLGEGNESIQRTAQQTSRILSRSTNFCVENTGRRFTKRETCLVMMAQDSKPAHDPVHGVGRCCDLCLRRKCAILFISDDIHFLMCYNRLVCSGNVPCMACSIRGIPSSCVYPDSYVPRPHRLSSCPASASTSPTQYQAVLQAQIDQTHGGHASFSNGAHSSIESPPSNVSEGPPPGTIQLGSETTVYVNSRHWTTRLVDFAEPDQRLLPDDACAVPAPRPHTKDEIVQSAGPAPQQPTACALLLHGSHLSTSRSDILSSLPERAVANRLVDTYFNMEALPRGEHHILQLIATSRPHLKSD